MADLDTGLIGEDDAHDRRREEAGFLLNLVRENEGDDDEHEADGILELLWDPEAGHEEHEDRGTGEAQSAAGDDGFGDGPRDIGGGLQAGPGEDDLEDEDGGERTYGVDDDAFPLEDGADRAGGADVMQERADDGWAGDDEDRAEEESDGRGDIEDEFGDQRGENAGDGRADGDQEDDGLADIRDFFEAEREAAFVEDEADRDADEGEEGIAQKRIRVDEWLAEEDLPSGAGDEAEEQEQEDGGKADAPGEPLSADAEGDDEEDGDLGLSPAAGGEGGERGEGLECCVHVHVLPGGFERIRRVSANPRWMAISVPRWRPVLGPAARA